MDATKFNNAMKRIDQIRKDLHHIILTGDIKSAEKALKDLSAINDIVALAEEAYERRSYHGKK
jgi:tRNA-dihydrouridine synthase